MKILIVDDEKDFTDMVSEYLQSLGYRIYSTYSGEQGLDILQKEKPDVLLCDLKMRGMFHGDDVLTRLKSLSPRTIPIILTAYKDEATQRRLMSKGAVRCLYKPIQLNEIESLLKELEEEL